MYSLSYFENSRNDSYKASVSATFMRELVAVAVVEGALIVVSIGTAALLSGIGVASLLACAVWGTEEASRALEIGWK